MMNHDCNPISIASHFEYYYRPTVSQTDYKTLVVSFPGRKSNRLFTSTPDEQRPFLWETLTQSDADILFMRSVYAGNPTNANITNDYDLLPDFLNHLKRERRIHRLVLFGFSLGCGPCLWLARKKIADEVILIAPGEAMLLSLGIIDDLRWEQDFQRFVTTGQLPLIEKIPDNIRIKILHGLHLEEDRLRERDLVNYLKLLAPQAELEGIQDVGHYIPQFWKEQGVLQESIFNALNIRSMGYPQQCTALDWSLLDSTSHTNTYSDLQNSYQPLFLR